eukprot:Gb_11850 [translate_table: standard]
MIVITPLLSDLDHTSYCNDEMERHRQGNNEEEWGLSVAGFPFRLDVSLRTDGGSTLVWIGRKFSNFSESISIQVIDLWDEGKSGITRESLLKPWDRVAVQVIKYFTLEEKSVKSMKVRKGKVPLPQGLVKLLYQFAKDKGGILVEVMRGGFPRSSGSLVPRAQLYLGVAPLGKDSLSPTSKLNVVLTESKDEEESPKKEVPKDLSRGGESQSLKQEKRKIVDYVDSFEEDEGSFDDGKDVEMGKGLEDPVPMSLPNRGTTPKPHGTFMVLEELRCHHKILNGLGESQVQLANSSKEKKMD